MKIIKRFTQNKLLTAVALIYIFLFAVMPEKAFLSVKNSMYYIIEMLEIIPVIFILTAIAEAWVPKELILKSFGDKSGIKGIVLSFVIGSLSSGPIYAAFPISKMLLKKGASLMNIVIIISSWAVIKVPMLANEAKFLGLEFMGIRWVLTVLSILAMAYLVSLLVKKEDMSAIKKADNNIYDTQQYCTGCGLCKNQKGQNMECPLRQKA